MTLLRALAVGLLSGGVGPLFLDPRGEGTDHLRLSVLTGLVAGQLLTVPASLLAATVWMWFRKTASARTARRSRPYVVPLGVVLLTAAFLVLAEVRGVLDWLATEPTPGGVGDPDGETGLALLAGLSACLMILVGLALLAHAVHVRRGGRVAAQADRG
ncbi:hypothetical protein AB0J81_25195 [Streptomyces bobili]|uniref:hypothetical protein n=1 Tax=Streptomyces bobili TaxID=67280 RepID=UPI00342E2998